MVNISHVIRPLFAVYNARMTVFGFVIYLEFLNLLYVKSSVHVMHRLHNIFMMMLNSLSNGESLGKSNKMLPSLGRWGWSNP